MVDEPPPNFFRPQKRARKPKSEPKPVAPVSYVNGLDPDADASLPPQFSDDALGLRFSEQYAPSLRFVAAWNRWMLWDGCVWKRDDTLRAYDLVRRTIRAAAGDTLSPEERAKLAAAAKVAAIEKLVRSDRRHALTADRWDADPWLLNTPRGIIDLRTGERMPHASHYLMTKCTAVEVGEIAACPRWLEFLARVTGNDLRLQDYLKRCAGYWLTGLIHEHAMWFLYGTGRNGKGVFLNTISRIMGDYAMTASPDTFTADGHGKHLTVLARLQGARLVVSQETEEGIPWAEARIKSVTGGDPITANYMRQDPFTYLPNFKLAIAGNHKPGLKSVDAAIRARLNLTPFTVTIPPTERDPSLSEKLWEEAPGILAWMLEGCADWRHVRLAPPPVVTLATEEYFDSEDMTALWVKECCDTGRLCEGLSGALFKSWTAWAITAGEKPGSNKTFSRTLEKHGFPRGAHSEFGQIINGIKLKVPSARTETEREREWP
jgi:P4 family phage/plasmid primase-like protien